LRPSLKPTPSAAGSALPGTWPFENAQESMIVTGASDNRRAKPTSALDHERQPTTGLPVAWAGRYSIAMPSAAPPGGPALSSK
jgi:hypothetical protein